MPARPNGRAPNGTEWDYQKGVWRYLATLLVPGVNGTAGVCLTAVGFGSAGLQLGWTAAAIQFVIAGVLLLACAYAFEFHDGNTRLGGWPDRLVLLVHGLAGLAGLGIVVVIPLLKSEARTALVEEFGVGLQLQLLERVMLRAGLAGKAGSGLISTFGCLAAVNFGGLCSHNATSVNRCTVLVAAAAALAVYYLAFAALRSGCGWAVYALLSAEFGRTFTGQDKPALPKLLADIDIWGVGNHGRAWSPWEPSTDLYPVWKMPFMPQLVTRMAVPVDVQWHAHTLETSNSQGGVHQWMNASAAMHAQNDAALERGRPDGLVIGYCADAVFTPWDPSHPVTCNHSPLASAIVLRNLADGVTLVGWAPPFYAFQHHMINGLPQLNASVELLKKLVLSPFFDRERVNLLCGPQTHCDAARAAGVDARVKLIGGHGVANQGHHVQHLVWVFPAKLDHTERADVTGLETQFAAYGYPRGAYSIADEFRVALNSEASSERARYIILISRERVRSRKLPLETRNALMDKLANTLSKDEYGTQLRVFTSPNGMANDSALFYGAQAVIAVHGGALSNLVFCKRGTHVIEALPVVNPRLMFAGIAYSRGLVHYTFNSDQWRLADWYSDETINLDADRFHDFIVQTLSLADVIRVKAMSSVPAAPPNATNGVTLDL